MKRRTRKFVGAVICVIYMLFYILLVVTAFANLFVGAMAHFGISTDTIGIKLAFYAVVGLIWILPLMPLIRWMERPDNGNA